jgi:sporulation protein YlmC with PRC-barrel domain
LSRKPNFDTQGEGKLKDDIEASSFKLSLKLFYSVDALSSGIWHVLNRLMDSTNSAQASGSDSASSKGSSFIKREDLIGKPVVGTDAIIVGTVMDLAVSPDGRVAIQVRRKNDVQSSNEQELDLFVGSEEIQAVADVILLKHKSTRAGQGMDTQSPAIGTEAQGSYTATVPYPPSPPPQVSTLKTCSRCGYANSPTSRFCIKCGNSLTS